MTKKKIKISLTEFINYVNTSGKAKATVVANAKLRREQGYLFFSDYWLQLREKIKEVHKNSLSQDQLFSVLEQIKEDDRENYNLAIKGYCKFWGKKKIEWVKPPQMVCDLGNLEIKLNPELGLKINNKTYIIKLFTTAKKNIDKRHADLIISLMGQEMREKSETESIFSVLDIKRGKLFTLKEVDHDILSLLKAEALSFESLWLDL